MQPHIFQLGFRARDGSAPWMPNYLPTLSPTSLGLRGVTRDAGGNPLGSCVVEAYETATGILVGVVTSDAGGNFSIPISNTPGKTYFLVAYLPGSPDRAGTTVNTLIGAGAS